MILRKLLELNIASLQCLYQGFVQGTFQSSGMDLDEWVRYQSDVAICLMFLLQSIDLLIDVLKLTLLQQMVSSLYSTGNLFV